MTATTYADFDGNTEALEVAKAFSENIHGKTIVITGVNKGGIGFSTAEAFASQAPAHIIVAGRSPSKLKDSIESLKAKFPNVDYRPLQLDLSSQKAVRSSANELLSWSDVPIVDIIVNSAGVMHVPERTLTEDGIEMHFATNHIGHFLFTCLIMPKILKAAEQNPKGATRIINVSSGSPTAAVMRWSDINFDVKTKDLPEREQPDSMFIQLWGVKDGHNLSYIPICGYNQSKVANVLLGIAINKRLYEKYGILSLGLHPGVIQTELGRTFSPETTSAVGALFEKGWFTYKTLGAGASTSLVAALDPKLGVGITKDGQENYGAYLSDCQIDVKARPLAVASDEAEKLWKLSEELVHEKFSW